MSSLLWVHTHQSQFIAPSRDMPCRVTTQLVVQRLTVMCLAVRATTHLIKKIVKFLFFYNRCPSVKVLSLKNNNLDHLPPDIGRLAKLQKLYLTNNRLQNGSIPYTLAFCRQLQELYLDDNLLDALPSVLLRIPSLTTVHRHGNHNYFKSTFMW